MNDGSIFLKKQFALMLSLFNYTDYYLIFLYSMWYIWIRFKITQVRKESILPF